MTPAYPLDTYLSRTQPLSAVAPIWTPQAGPLPALYLGHGAPPLLDDTLWMNQLWDWSAAIPKPRAILVVSAHWESAPLAISASEANTPLVYDFGGFAQRYFDLTYKTPDAEWLATAVASLMPDSEPIHKHTQRGLDHGAWVPLLLMYPLGDVPVLQLSIPTHDPARLLALGQRLGPLRDLGVLIVGSGFLTHGLPYLSREHWADTTAAAPGWSKDFDAWAAEALDHGDVDALSNYVHGAPGMPYAHPTVEHYSPLFVALGAGTEVGAAPTTVIDGFWMGLSKRSFQVA